MRGLLARWYVPAMKLVIVSVLVVAAVACGKSVEEQAKEDMAAKAPKPDEPSPAPKVIQQAPAPEAKPAAAPEAKPAAAPEPEPTTPAEIDHAFKQAMIDGRDKDVLKYCDMLKLDDHSNPQSLMGCTLSACRIGDAATAKRYAAGLEHSKDGLALLSQARKVCILNKVGI